MVDVVIISYNGLLVDQAVRSLNSVKNDTPVNIIVQQSKQSIPKNVNEGFKSVVSDWFVLFNDDWEAIQDGWLDRMMSFRADDIGFVSCRVVFNNGLLNHVGYKISSNGLVVNMGRNKPDEIYPDEFIRYAHPILINSSVFRNMGGYDDKFIGSQFADIDYVYRVSGKYRIFFAGSSVILHHWNENKATNAVRDRSRRINEGRFRSKHGFHKKVGF